MLDCRESCYPQMKSTEVVVFAKGWACHLFDLCFASTSGSQKSKCDIVFEWCRILYVILKTD